MRAYALDEFGHSGSIHVLPIPEPAAGEVLVRLRAASLNAFDCSVVAGRAKDYMEHRFPLIPALDGAGAVERLGDGATGFSIGDAVFGLVQRPFMGQGTLAEYQTFAASDVAVKPAELGFREAAALPTAGLTALAAIDALDPREGQVVVVLGATGGVGSFAVQLATAKGARIVAVSRGGRAEYARSLGAADVVDYTVGDATQLLQERYPDGIDAVLDFAGQRELVAGIADLVRTGGRVVSTVGAADVESLAARGITGINANRAETDRLAELAAVVTAGGLKIPQLTVFSLDQAADALAAQAERRVPGKIVIDIG
ncbi:MAG TPA: NADP-dependent oxidoreductase [Candidatus Eisenbacteria bacterium]|nr:NADP-dependent oxidoreductase [Candidatus Eisenbacteria bacterium]